MMTNDDLEGWIFLSHPHTNKGFVFLFTVKYGIRIFERSLSEILEIRYDAI